MNRVYIFSDIDDELALKVITRMRLLCTALQEKDKDREGKVPIHVYINTGGGDLEAACAIIDEIINVGKTGRDVYTICQGRAYSAGALILCAGNEVYATPNSHIMFHPVSIELPLDRVEEQQNYANFTTEHYNSLLKTLARRRGKRISKFKEEISRTWYMRVAEAKRHKIIDDVWDYKKWEIYN